MSTEQLWREYRASGHRSVRWELVRRHLRIVGYHARRMNQRSPACVSEDELYSAGVDGLYKAVGRFDPDRGVGFATYASRPVLGAMLDWMRQEDRLSRSMRRRFEKLQAARRQLSGGAQGAPTRRELMRHLGVDGGEMDRMEADSGRALALGRVASLSDVVLEADIEGQERRRLDFLVDPRQPDPAAAMSGRENFDHLLVGLDAVSQSVLRLYYQREWTMGRIGRRLGLSESRISQVHTRALAILRQKLRARQRAA